jgi:hypothetical protein
VDQLAGWRLRLRGAGEQAPGLRDGQRDHAGAGGRRLAGPGGRGWLGGAPRVPWRP